VSIQIPEYDTMQIRPKFGQIYNNGHKKPNKIFSVKTLLKRAKFSKFCLKKAKPQPCPEVFSGHLS